MLSFRYERGINNDVFQAKKKKILLGENSYEFHERVKICNEAPLASCGGFNSIEFINL